MTDEKRARIKELRSKLANLSPEADGAEQKEALHEIYNLWQSYKSRRDELKKSRYFGHIIGEVDIVGEMFIFDDGVKGQRFLTEAQYLEYRDSYWFFGPVGICISWKGR